MHINFIKVDAEDRAVSQQSKRYLIEDYSIAIAPGLQLLAPEPLQIRRGRVLLGGVSEGWREQNPLPFVQEELQRLKQLLRSKLLLNRALTREALAKNVQSSDFTVVHLATHGEFSSKIEGTYISAWDGPIQVAQLSSILRERDRPVPIELLVLSACETAPKDERAALGLAGIAVQAGARSTLASLWNIDDQASSKFIQAFYRALNADKSRAEALQAAQLEVLGDLRYRAPVHWAPYVLIGNWL